MKKIKVVGIGNSIMQDDGIGVHVINKMAEMDFPSNIEFVDAGVNSYDMVDIFCQADSLIIVDAMHTGGEPGTIYRAPLDELGLKSIDSIASLHEMHFIEAINMVRLLGANPEVIVYGIEPQTVSLGLELTPLIADKVPRLMELIQEELIKLNGN